MVYLFLVFSFLGGAELFADEVSVKEAKQVAINWYRYFSKGKNKAFSNEAVVFSELSENNKIYIFSFAAGGFVVISSDDMIEPVLAYSFDSEIVDINRNPALHIFLDAYSNIIKNHIAQNHKRLEKHVAWDEIASNDFSRYRKKTYDFVAPLITSKWDQGKGWNKYCPEDPAAYGGHAPTGCVAVALGQLLSKWNFPEYGDGSNSFDNQKYGIIAANFESTKYNWFDMSDTIPDDHNALILYHCGVALYMKYNTYNSSTDTYFRSIPALINHFRYNPEIVHKRKSEYSKEYWGILLKNELVNDRPLIYRARDNETKEGHAFNIDGFQNSYFHINWGWEGKGNGYFLLDIPKIKSYEFGLNQGAIFGIFPRGLKVYPPPEDLEVDEKVGKIKLNWKAPFKNENAYYNIYRDDRLIISTNELTFTDSLVQNTIDYKYYVTAVYTGEYKGESKAFNYVIASPSIPLIPPLIYDFENNFTGWNITDDVFSWNHDETSINSFVYSLPYHSPGYLNDPHIHSTMLISPYLNLSGCGSVSIAFNYFFKYIHYYQDFGIYYRESEDSEWIMINNIPYSEFLTDHKWRTKEIILPEEACTKQMQLGFYYKSGLSLPEFRSLFDLFGNEINTIGVDDIRIIDNNVFPAPLDLILEWKPDNIEVQVTPPLDILPDFYKIYRNDSLLRITRDTLFSDTSIRNGFLYSYYVTSVYDSVESIRSEVKELLTCPVETVPYSQNFEKKSLGWIIEDGPVIWANGNSLKAEILTSNKGSFCYSNSREESMFPSKTRIVSPGFNLDSLKGAMLVFDYILMKGENFAGLDLMCRTGGDNNWKILNKLDITGNWNSWTKKYLILPEHVLTDFTQFAFLFQTMGNPDKFAGVDNIEIREIADKGEPVDLNYTDYGSFIELEWTSSNNNNPDHYNIYRNDSLAGVSRTGIFRDADYNASILCSYFVTAVYSYDSLLESAPSELLRIPAKAPYIQEFKASNNGWSIRGENGHFCWKAPYTDSQENLINETGFVYFGMGLDNSGKNDLMISPVFFLEDNFLTLTIDYLFNDFDFSKNELFINYRKSVEEDWERLYILPPTGKYWIYNSVEISIPEECLNKKIQFSLEYKNNNENIPAYIRFDNFIINNFSNLLPPHDLVTIKNSNSVLLKWSGPPYSNPEKYNVYRNLKKIGETKSLTFTDTDLSGDKTYFYNVKAVYGGSKDLESVSTNQSVVNYDPVFELPYFESFDKPSNYQWKSDRVFWEYQNNQNLGIKTNNPSTYFGFKLLEPEWIRYDSWLLSPMFQALDTDSVILSFKYLFKCYYPEQFQNLQIYYRTENNFVWTLLEELNASPTADQWENYSVKLPNDLMKSNFQIGYFAHRTRPFSGLFVGGIDDISIRSVKGLLQPENFDFGTNDQLIMLTWTEPDGEKPDKYFLYRNDTLIGETNSLFYNDYEVQNLIEYNYKLTAVYGETTENESLPAEIETAISMYSSYPPYYWDFEESYDDWDISGNPVGWMWGSKRENDFNKYLFTRFDLWPPKDIVRSPYMSLDFEGSLFLTFDYCSWGGNFQTFNLMYRSIGDTSWTILMDLPVNLENGLLEFERKTLLLPDEIMQECIQFAFNFQNDDSFFGYSAIDNFSIEGKEGVYSPDSLRFAISDQKVELFWDPPVINIPDYYNLYRDDSLLSISYTTHYSDLNVINGIKYQYKTTAVFGGIDKIESFPTNTITVMPFPFENIPYMEDFENENYKWFDSRINDGFMWIVSGVHELGNDNNTKFISIETTGETEAQIISPFFLLNDKNNVLFSFDYYLEKYFFLNNFSLLYRKNPDSDWKKIIDLDPTKKLWTNLSVELTDEVLSDSLQLMFLFTSLGNIPALTGAKIDNIKLFSQSTGLKLDKYQPEITVYPNPGNGIVYIDSESINGSEIKVEVFNNKGNRVYTRKLKKLASPLKIDLRKYKCGIYYFRIYINNISVIRKIIIR